MFTLKLQTRFTFPFLATEETALMRNKKKLRSQKPVEGVDFQDAAKYLERKSIKATQAIERLLDGHVPVADDFFAFEGYFFLRRTIEDLERKISIFSFTRADGQKMLFDRHEMVIAYAFINKSLNEFGDICEVYNYKPSTKVRHFYVLDDGFIFPFAKRNFLNREENQ
jgi:hypothetical protein